MNNIDVCAIAKWFFDNNESCRMRTFDGNAKLQKLIYYAQAMYSAVYYEPLFSEQIQAWENGPVVRKVYDSKNNNEFDKMNEVYIDDEVEEILQIVNSVYGVLTTDELIEQTHEEEPWKELENLAKGRYNPEIKFEKIKAFYKDLRDIYEVYEGYDFSSEALETINGNNFSFNKNEVSLTDDDFYMLAQIGYNEKSRTYNVLKNDDGKLVIY